MYTKKVLEMYKYLSMSYQWCLNVKAVLYLIHQKTSVLCINVFYVGS